LHRPADDRVPGVGRALVVCAQGVSVNSRRDVRIGMTEACRYRRQRNGIASGDEDEEDEESDSDDDDQD
jgi:hypothetical protein